jgi:UDP-N-acetylglucosamine--N-acetylmuramyl-(pentapeptide) pyrophosphoryl-undecaprenol N-acetylglucosamine transferase
MTAPRRIVLTGGGSAGHVTPNLALLPRLREQGWEIEYIGSRSGIERELVQTAGLPYHAIDSGKLRRYASWQNWIDPLRVLSGLAQAYRILGRLAPDAVFSKGGYVTVPVVIAAWLRRIPVVVHESDRSPGLANRMAFPFAARICTAFQDTAAQLQRSVRDGPQRVIWTGSPIRFELMLGDALRAERHFGLDSSRSLVLIVGGSLGARAINTVTGELARSLPNDLEILHICGKGNLDPELAGIRHYHAFEYLQEQYADALARADVVVSRAGANSLAELIALHKPALLIPLPADASRGDQIENARLYTERGYGLLLPQSELDRTQLEHAIRRVLAEAPLFRERLAGDIHRDAAKTITGILSELKQAP